MPWVINVPLLQRILKHRFVKFGIIGFSGTIVNLGVLYAAQEYLFPHIHPDQTRLNLSLSLAIFCATLNNFTWNRIWTWGDRKKEIKKSLIFQLGQYFLACWLSIILQFLFTKMLAQFCHYLIANVTAIILAAVVNFVLNDRLTFGIKKRPYREE